MNSVQDKDQAWNPVEQARQRWSKAPSQYQPLVDQIRSNLTPDLLKPQFREAEFPTGHCYVASEALYHTLGGQGSGLKPMRLKMPDGVVHWWLETPDGEIIDPTHDQFEEPVPYHEGKAGGFLTREPSKRAQTLMSRLGKTSAFVVKNIVRVPLTHEPYTNSLGAWIYYWPTQTLYYGDQGTAHEDLLRYMKLYSGSLMDTADMDDEPMSAGSYNYLTGGTDWYGGQSPEISMGDLSDIIESDILERASARGYIDWDKRESQGANPLVKLPNGTILVGDPSDTHVDVMLKHLGPGSNWPEIYSDPSSDFGVRWPDGSEWWQSAEDGKISANIITMPGEGHRFGDVPFIYIPSEQTLYMTDGPGNHSTIFRYLKQQDMSRMDRARLDPDEMILGELLPPPLPGSIAWDQDNRDPSVVVYVDDPNKIPADLINTLMQLYPGTEILSEDPGWGDASKVVVPKQDQLQLFHSNKLGADPRLKFISTPDDGFGGNNRKGYTCVYDPSDGTLYVNTTEGSSHANLIKTLNLAPMTASGFGYDMDHLGFGYLDPENHTFHDFNFSDGATIPNDLLEEALHIMQTPKLAEYNDADPQSRSDLNELAWSRGDAGFAKGDWIPSILPENDVGKAAYAIINGQMYIAPRGYHSDIVKYLRHNQHISDDDIADGFFGYIRNDEILPHSDGYGIENNWHDEQRARDLLPTAIDITQSEHIAAGKYVDEVAPLRPREDTMNDFAFMYEPNNDHLVGTWGAHHSDLVQYYRSNYGKPSNDSLFGYINSMGTPVVYDNEDAGNSTIKLEDPALIQRVHDLAQQNRSAKVSANRVYITTFLYVPSRDEVYEDAGESHADLVRHAMADYRYDDAHGLSTFQWMTKEKPLLGWVFDIDGNYKAFNASRSYDELGDESLLPEACSLLTNELRAPVTPADNPSDPHADMYEEQLDGVVRQHQDGDSLYGKTAAEAILDRGIDGTAVEPTDWLDGHWVYDPSTDELILSPNYGEYRYHADIIRDNGLMDEKPPDREYEDLRVGEWKFAAGYPDVNELYPGWGPIHDTSFIMRLVNGIEQLSGHSWEDLVSAWDQRFARSVVVSADNIDEPDSGHFPNVIHHNDGYPFTHTQYPFIYHAPTDTAYIGPAQGLHMILINKLPSEVKNDFRRHHSDDIVQQGLLVGHPYVGWSTNFYAPRSSDDEWEYNMRQFDQNHLPDEEKYQRPYQLLTDYANHHAPAQNSLAHPFGKTANKWTVNYVPLPDDYEGGDDWLWENNRRPVLINVTRKQLFVGDPGQHHDYLYKHIKGILDPGDEWDWDALLPDGTRVRNNNPLFEARNSEMINALNEWQKQHMNKSAHDQEGEYTANRPAIKMSDGTVYEGFAGQTHAGLFRQLWYEDKLKNEDDIVDYGYARGPYDQPDYWWAGMDSHPNVEQMLHGKTAAVKIVDISSDGLGHHGMGYPWLYDPRDDTFYLGDKQAFHIDLIKAIGLPINYWDRHEQNDFPVVAGRIDLDLNNPIDIFNFGPQEANERAMEWARQALDDVAQFSDDWGGEDEEYTSKTAGIEVQDDPDPNNYIFTYSVPLDNLVVGSRDWTRIRYWQQNPCAAGRTAAPSGQWMYHMSPVSERQNIMLHGLNPNKGRRLWETHPSLTPDNYPRATYMFDNLDSYDFSNPAEIHGEPFDLWAIDVGGLPVEDDPISPHLTPEDYDEEESPYIPQSYMTRYHIGPERLHLLGTENADESGPLGWEPFTSKTAGVTTVIMPPASQDLDVAHASRPFFYDPNKRELYLANQHGFHSDLTTAMRVDGYPIDWGSAVPGWMHDDGSLDGWYSDARKAEIQAVLNEGSGDFSNDHKSALNNWPGTDVEPLGGTRMDLLERVRRDLSSNNYVDTTQEGNENETNLSNLQFRTPESSPSRHTPVRSGFKPIQSIRNLNMSLFTAVKRIAAGFNADSQDTIPDQGNLNIGSTKPEVVFSAYREVSSTPGHYDQLEPWQAEMDAEERYIKLKSGQIITSPDLWHSMIVREHNLRKEDIEDAGYIMPDGTMYSFLNHEDANAPYLVQDRQDPHQGAASRVPQGMIQEHIFNSGGILKDSRTNIQVVTEPQVGESQFHLSNSGAIQENSGTYRVSSKAWVYDPDIDQLYEGQHHLAILRSNPELADKFRITNPPSAGSGDLPNFSTPLVLGWTLGNWYGDERDDPQVFSDYGYSTATPEQEQRALELARTSLTASSGNHRVSYSGSESLAWIYVAGEVFFGPTHMDIIARWAKDTEQNFNEVKRQLVNDPHILGWVDFMNGGPEIEVFSDYGEEWDNGQGERYPELAEEAIQAVEQATARHARVSSEIGDLDPWRSDTRFVSSFWYDPQEDILYGGNQFTTHPRILKENPELVEKAKAGELLPGQLRVDKKTHEISSVHLWTDEYDYKMPYPPGIRQKIIDAFQRQYGRHIQSRRSAFEPRVVEISTAGEFPGHDAWIYDSETNTLYYGQGTHHGELVNALAEDGFDRRNFTQSNRFMMGDVNTQDGESYSDIYDDPQLLQPSEEILNYVQGLARTARVKTATKEVGIPTSGMHPWGDEPFIYIKPIDTVYYATQSGGHADLIRWLKDHEPDVFNKYIQVPQADEVAFGEFLPPERSGYDWGRLIFFLPDQSDLTDDEAQQYFPNLFQWAFAHWNYEDSTKTAAVNVVHVPRSPDFPGLDSKRRAVIWHAPSNTLLYGDEGGGHPELFHALGELPIHAGMLPNMKGTMNPDDYAAGIYVPDDDEFYDPKLVGRVTWWGDLGATPPEEVQQKTNEIFNPNV